MPKKNKSNIMEKLDTLDLYNDDCFNVFPQLEDKSINLFILDLPYNQTACKWDKDIIPLDEMWKHIKRIMKPNGIIVMFCNARFGNKLFNSNPKWFRYELIWKKSRKVGFLSANRKPLVQHENIYLFKPEQGTYHPQKTEGKPYKGVNKWNTTKDNECYGYSRCQDEYIIENKGDRHPTSIIDHENIYLFKEEQGTYHPQKTKGKAYIDKRIDKNKSYYRNDDKTYQQTPRINNGDRHPTSIIEQDKDLGMIEGGYYRGEGKKPFKRMAAHPTERHPTSIIDHENIYLFKEEQGTYNPQKTEGKPYTKNRKGHTIEKYCYGGIDRGDDIKINNGDRHPTSIIDHENIYLFSNANNDDLEISRNKDLREYAQKVKKYIGKTKTEIIKEIGQTIDHFFRIKSSQFGIPTKETYNKLIELYKLDEMPDFIPYETLKEMWVKEQETTYNPQKTEGKPYKTNGRKDGLTVYGSVTGDPIENKGDRHPASLIDYDGDSILIYKNPHKTIHRTQKPVELCEWLIKTYSNEEDTVMDFTMGSGTTAIACLNTNRKFIGVEKDKEIFDKAEDRIAEYLEF